MVIKKTRINSKKTKIQNKKTKKNKKIKIKNKGTKKNKKIKNKSKKLKKMKKNINGGETTEKEKEMENFELNENNIQNKKIHYIVLLHGEQQRDIVKIPLYNDKNSIQIIQYIEEGQKLILNPSELTNICNPQNDVIKPTKIILSGNDVKNIMFQHRNEKGLGVYVCQENKISSFYDFKIHDNFDLVFLITSIYGLNNTINGTPEFKISLLNCRGFESEENLYSTIEKINPDILLNNFNFNYSIKIWDFDDNDYFTFKPIDCEVPKQQQRGCALQTLFFLKEISKTPQLEKEILDASVNEKQTVGKIIPILNNNLKNLYSNQYSNQITYLYNKTGSQPNFMFKELGVNFEVSNFGSTQIKVLLSRDIENICKKLKNNQATLIKMNREGGSHVICFIKRQGKCTFIDPQQIKEYSVEEFTNFADRFKLTSIEVLLEKEQPIIKKNKENNQMNVDYYPPNYNRTDLDLDEIFSRVPIPMDIEKNDVPIPMDVAMDVEKSDVEDIDENDEKMDID